MAIKPLTDRAVDEVVERLGFAQRPATDIDGLRDLYQAWCRQVPFDNLRKLVALHFDLPEIPGIEPADFFAAWQLTGAGATCWGSNNAMHALVTGLGFDAQLTAASMFDGEKNHGTTIVTIDGQRWIVDTALHGDVPAPMIDGETTTIEHCGYRTIVRADEKGWLFDHPMPDPDFSIPCRIIGDMDYAASAVANEKSRGWSPFNTAIMVGINDETGVWMLKDNSLARIDDTGISTRQMSEGEVDEFLIEVSGHSPQLVAEVRAILDVQSGKVPPD
ncbi:MAG: arylamine N-acetyltransferase [Acidimicrobiales bacterium]|nr:arylamine N-acetyltransferase [Acidimicrobiales bacterium]